MKNYCTSYSLSTVIDCKHYPLGTAFTKATLRKRAKKFGLSWYCIETIRTENFVSTVVKIEFFHD